ncbi:MAG TPA: hypothetical protein VMU14_09785 [Acidimicrobiales bacterium]|nr:hypothetical protein [Acidimicrobiales bacterium]
MNDILDEPEGWYLDPYGVHELRWFSAGKPTGLVRDGGVDGHEAPPAGPPPTGPVRPPEAGAAEGAHAGGEDPGHEVFSAAFGNLGVQP